MKLAILFLWIITLCQPLVDYLMAMVEKERTIDIMEELSSVMRLLALSGRRVKCL